MGNTGDSGQSDWMILEILTNLGNLNIYVMVSVMVNLFLLLQLTTCGQCICY